mgnify:CR=1 FL=1
MQHLMTRTPVNKMASVMVNQCNCASELELNNLLEQRRIVKANATMWMKESAKSNGAKHRVRPLIKQANIELLELNRKLKPYDEWHRSETPKSYDHAFRMEVKRVFGDEIFKQLELRAKATSGA